MLDILKDIFENVNNLLKFAEAKNGIIIALNATVIFGIFKLGVLSLDTSSILNWYLYITIFMLLTSLIIALLSFVPKLKYPYLSFEKPLETDNLLYFGDIAKYTPTQYKKHCEKIIKLDDKDYQNNCKLTDDYINQIVINSKITFIKFKQFEIAIWFTLSAILTPIGGMILYYSQARNS